MRFDRNLSRAHAKEGKKKREKKNGFKFGIFIDRFPSDGAANMAVKGLKISDTGSHTIVWTRENTAHTDRNG